MSLKELLKKLLANGFATATEKLIVKGLFNDLKKKEADEVKEDVEAVEALPEEAPEEDATEEEVAETLEKMVKKATEKVSKEYEEKLEAYKTEQKELATKRAGLYNPEIKEARAELNSRVRKFIEALTINDVAYLKDLSEGTDNKGGYLVDTELSAQVEHLLTEYGVARREFFTTPLSKGSLVINNLATDVSVYWTDEAVAKTSSDVVLGQVELTLKKLAVIVPMTDELLEDSEIDIVSFLTERIAEGFAYQEDYQFFRGTGSPFTGLLENANVNTVTLTGTTFASVDANDLLDMIDATPQGALKNGKFYGHRSIKSYLRALQDDNGQYIYQAPSQTGPETVWGKPWVDVEAMPSSSDTGADEPFIIFGDLKKGAWLGFKGGLRVKISDQATVRNTAGSADIDLFRQDMTALRIVERVGYVVVIPSAITVLSTASASA